MLFAELGVCRKVPDRVSQKMADVAVHFDNDDGNGVYIWPADDPETKKVLTRIDQWRRFHGTAEQLIEQLLEWLSSEGDNRHWTKGVGLRRPRIMLVTRRKWCLVFVFEKHRARWCWDVTQQYGKEHFTHPKPRWPYPGEPGFYQDELHRLFL